MKTHTIFCSACDRDVDVTARSGDELAGGDVACAEHGVSCTGTACPLCARCLNADERREVRPGIVSTAA